MLEWAAPVIDLIVETNPISAVQINFAPKSRPNRFARLGCSIIIARFMQHRELYLTLDQDSLTPHTSTLHQPTEILDIIAFAACKCMLYSSANNLIMY